ncbi:MAG: HD domain-containing protein [Hydrococcus sp. RU_2_2]|nr:HD domain-containing protein [Hydrococcus sp. RU_2_2]NJP19135.1 HD domain-containing protein [Hydrococcus sp. CRU_1_1]NJQ96502.1 HD domain-containing protein [Hydrococcus sp. CSU_1_8]
MGEIRLAEVMTSLAMATGLGMGQSMDWALRGCLLSVRFAEAIALAPSILRDVYYLSLLHYIGCTTDAHQAARFFGNDLNLMRYFALNHMGIMPLEATELSNPLTPKQAPPPDWQRESNLVRCDVAMRLAKWCGFWTEIQTGLWQLFERWNGEGLPNGLKGEAIILPVRLVQIAQDAETFYRIGGVKTAIAVIKERAGSGYDPDLAACFCSLADELFISLEEVSLRQAILDAEPLPQHILSAKQFERTLEAIADFVDIKSPFTAGHSRGVAKLAVSTAKQFDLPEESVRLLRQAALLHDIGQVSIPTEIVDKPTALTECDWEQIRLHPYFTERVFARAQPLQPIGATAALHRERLDGSGYHRGLPASMQPLIARILATAEVYQAMTEPRSYRPPIATEDASKILQQEVAAGKLDGEVVKAILTIAGHSVSSQQRQWAGGLSQREIEVLRFLARGHSNREIAEILHISIKTVGHHVQHIYNKLGVSNRAAATLYAMQHSLLHDHL